MSLLPFEILERLRLKQEQCLVDVSNYCGATVFSDREKALVRAAFGFGAAAGIDAQKAVDGWAEERTKQCMNECYCNLLRRYSNDKIILCRHCEKEPVKARVF